MGEWKTVQSVVMSVCFFFGVMGFGKGAYRGDPLILVIAFVPLLVTFILWRRWVAPKKSEPGLLSLFFERIKLEQKERIRELKQKQTEQSDGGDKPA